MPKYKSKVKGNQLVVRAKCSSKEQLNERELEYFSGKYLKGFLKAEYVKKMGFTGIEYTGIAGVSLQKFLKKPMTKDAFFLIIGQITDAVRNINCAGLYADKIEWDFEQVYINNTTGELQFIYLPLGNRKKSANVLGFLNKIVSSIRCQKGQSLEYVSAFSAFLRSQMNFNPDVFERYMQEQGVKAQIPSQNNYTNYNNGVMYQVGMENNDGTCVLKRDETVVLQGETCVLQGNNDNCYPTLIQLRTNGMVRVNKQVYRLGKEGGSVDYYILNNSAVSRNHVDIITRGQRYFVRDLGSKNGTYINECMIPSNVEVEIRNQDRLMLADEEFVFISGPSISGYVGRI